MDDYTCFEDFMDEFVYWISCVTANENRFEHGSPNGTTGNLLVTILDNSQNGGHSSNHIWNHFLDDTSIFVVIFQAYVEKYKVGNYFLPAYKDLRVLISLI